MSKHDQRTYDGPAEVKLSDGWENLIHQILAAQWAQEDAEA